MLQDPFSVEAVRDQFMKELRALLGRYDVTDHRGRIYRASLSPVDRWTGAIGRGKHVRLTVHLPSIREKDGTFAQFGVDIDLGFHVSSEIPRPKDSPRA